MLNTRDVEKACRRYFVQGILITAFLSLIVVALYIQFPEWNLIAPMIMTDIFSLTVCIAEALVLRIVAKHGTENLHNFFTAATGLRMFLALFTLTGCYLVEGRDALLRCIHVVLFCISYSPFSVLHSCIEFSRQV